MRSYRGALSVIRFAAIGLLCLGLGIGASPKALAQITSATILGTVTDQSGAAVPNAKVTVTNVSTGLTYSSTAGADGGYLVPLLPITGNYTVTIEASRFEKFVQTGIVLEVNQNARVDASLKVGAASETVQVSGEPALVDTHSSSLGDVVMPAQVTELPLNGRNPAALAELVAGVTTISAPEYMTNRSGSELSVNGSRENENDYLFDGAHYEDAVFGIGKNLPNPDALQEFNLITNTFSAEYGRSAGSIFNAVPKSGTNDIHGSACDFLRNTDFNSKNWFLNAPGDKAATLHQNQFGFTLGGPAIRNKLFWFGSYQGLRIKTQSLLTSGCCTPVSVTTPTAQERQGLFTTPLNDPTTGLPIPPNAQGLYFIDPSRFSAVTVAVMNAVLPTPGPDGLLHQLGNKSVTNDQFLVKSDYNVTAKNALSFSYFQDHTSTNDPFFNSGILGWGGAVTPTHTLVTSLHDTQTFRPNLLNQLRLSYFKTQDTISPIDPQKNLFQWGDTSYIQDPAVINQNPDFNVAGAFSLVTVGVLDFKENTFNRQGADTVTWIHGAHSFKTGVEIDSLLQHGQASFLTNGSFTFTGAVTGNAIADFLVGAPVNYSRDSPGLSDLTSWEYSAFFQDDWRISRRVTLNLGMRYFLELPWVYANNHAATFRLGEQSKVFPSAPTGLVYPGDPGVPRGFYPTEKKNFEPRLGLVWDPKGDGKTSVRISYGIFHDLFNTIGLGGQPGANQPYVFSESFFEPPGGTDNTYQGFPNPWPYRAYLSPNPTFVLPAAVSADSPNIRNPFIQGWAGDVQHQFTPALVGEVAYVGKNSVHLYENIEANPAIYFPGTDPATGQPYSTNANVDSRRIYAPTFAGIREIFSSGRAQYNALELTAKYRMRHGLLFTAVYTRSRSTDTSSTFANGAESFYPNPQCLPCNIGPSDYDLANVFRASWVYDLPGPSGGGMVAKQLLSNWEISGITTLQSGPRYSIGNGVSSSLNGLGEDRADLIGDPQLSNGRSRTARVQEWFNTSAFAIAALGTTGDSTRNFMVGPAFIDTDLAVMKNFPISERYGKLQLRAEFFNAFNRVNFGVPVNVVTSPAFGQITTAGDPRIIQMSLKYSF